MTQEKIIVAELLKDCPTGMELDCTMFEKPIKYKGLTEGEPYIINIETPCGGDFYLTKEGYLYDLPDSKSIIFPKGKTTWEGFVPPCKFKDGDVVATDSGAWLGITTGGEKGGLMPVYCVIQSNYFEAYLGTKNKWYFDRLATEEEKERLFKAIKANGYCWNAETKTLEKLVEPKFKVGDKVRGKYTNSIYTISGITPTGYELTNGQTFTFNAEDCHELVTGKFDFTTLKPFDKVLVRNTNNGRWRGQFYMSYDKNEEYPFECTYNCWMQCIPFEGNEHLLGKTDNCIDFYKTWE